MVAQASVGAKGEELVDDRCRYALKHCHSQFSRITSEVIHSELSRTFSLLCCGGRLMEIGVTAKDVRTAVPKLWMAKENNVPRTRLGLLGNFLDPRRTNRLH